MILIQISTFLAKFPSFGYAMLYISAIPIFATIYTFCIPSHFYHSTVQYEENIDHDAEILLKALQEAIILEFKNFHGNIQKAEGNWDIDISQIRLHSLNPEKDRISFKISVILNGINDLQGGQSRMILVCSIEQRIEYAVALPPKYEKIVYKQPECTNTNLFPLSLKLIFPAVPSINTSPELLFLPISIQIQNKIIAFTNAVSGFPSKVSGVFGRMFYFSAVTITTLGYGDIVPISNTARIIVAIESVLGIVLVGLFLNSLSWESRNRTTKKSS